MQVARQEVQDLVNQMPEQCELEDLHYKLYVLEKIKKGQRSIKEQGGISNEVAMEQLSQWIIK